MDPHVEVSRKRVLGCIATFPIPLVLGALWFLWLWPRASRPLNPIRVFVPSEGFDRRWVGGSFIWLVATLVATAVFGHALVRCLRDARARRRLAFMHVAALLSLVAAAVVTELGSRIVVPPWPYRDLRPAKTDAKLHELSSWGVRDRERPIAKPEGARRVVFIGDSFLEGAFTRRPLTRQCEDALAERSRPEMECVNLGVSATDPRHYFFRWESVGKKIEPDAVFVFFYSGNDFVAPDQGAPLPRAWLREPPLPSVVRSVAPCFEWLLADRLQLSQISRNRNLASTFDELERLSRSSYEEGVRGAARLIRDTYFPQVEVEKVEAILRRRGPELWKLVEPREVDREYLQGWLLETLVQRELDRTYGSPFVDLQGTLDATMSWLVALDEDCRGVKVPLTIFVIPEASQVDPVVNAFWEPWPFAAHGISRPVEEIYDRFIEALRARHLAFVDLRSTFQGHSGTYRITDRHWTEKGQLIVRDRVVAELLR